jgi:hypothetical protein
VDWKGRKVALFWDTEEESFIRMRKLSLSLKRMSFLFRPIQGEIVFPVV